MVSGHMEGLSHEEHVLYETPSFGFDRASQGFDLKRPLFAAAFPPNAELRCRGWAVDVEQAAASDEARAGQRRTR